MPTLAKNIHIGPFKAGSLVSAARVNGYAPVVALKDASDAFFIEHGRAYDEERSRILINFTTFETHCEIIEAPEED